jgi:two-component system C4-dicarboxylate transport sensor histidine kinase DctB
VKPDVSHLPVPRGLHQVITNLLRNAYDAAGPEETIDVEARRDSGRLVIEVRDRGPGIPADIIDRVFEPFFTTKAPGQGTGLGLPLSARMVQKFGGGIRIDTPSEGGTVVVLWLPMPRPVAEEPLREVS